MIAACYILHYGKEWLSWSMRSVASCVDEICVFYSKSPSHGTQTNLRNPDTRDELYAIAQMYRGYWHDSDGYPHEGAHRTFAVETCKALGADLVVVVDADEVWSPEVLNAAIYQARQKPNHSFRIGMRHFWRSTKWVCDDPAMPTRLIRTDVPDNYGEAYLGEDVGKVFHFGYAQSPATIRYKQSIHGHIGEWRQDWFTAKFLNWKPGMTDVHPTCVNYWNPVPYTDTDFSLNYLISDHPYYNQDIIV